MTEQTDLDRLEEHLEPGERVLWVGSPSPKWFSPRALVELVGPMLFISFFLLVVVVIALAVSGTFQELLDDVQAWSILERWLWTSMAISLPCSLVMATALVLMLVSALGWAHRRKDLYAITDRGFLWQRNVWPFSQHIWPVHRFSLDEVNAVEITRHADGTGTIVFPDEWVSFDVDQSVNPSFARIPEVDLALAIAYAAAEQAGIPQPERPSGWQVMGQAFRNWLVAIVVGSVGAVVVCLGASSALGVAISAQGQDLGNSLQLPYLWRRSGVFQAAAVTMFVTALAGLWSLAVRSRLRCYPHLRRLRRLLAWLRVALTLIWLGTMAWIVLTLVN